MSGLKDQDPDYSPSVADNERHRRIYEENARTTTARKITAIVEKEFSEEISAKEKEVLEIQEKVHSALKNLHLLRYVIIADFYNRKQCQITSQPGEPKQTQIHPAIKRLIGKTPKNYDCPCPSTSSNGANFSSSRSASLSPSASLSDCSIPSASSVECEKSARKRNVESQELQLPKKVPRYVPPRSGIPETPCPSRGVRHKVRRRIIVGNISKWIPPDWREDAASHKWTMYVRGNKENPEVGQFVSKVRFFLHPSYRPNDVVEVTSAPFCLSRRGWGEFPLRVQLHFKSGLNKPMDIIHHLKLDRTYTGLQTLGAETLVDIWIYEHQRSRKINDLQQENERAVESEGESVETILGVETRIKQEVKDSVESDINAQMRNTNNSTSTENEVVLKIETAQNERDTIDDVGSRVWEEEDCLKFPNEINPKLIDRRNHADIRNEISTETQKAEILPGTESNVDVIIQEMHNSRTVSNNTNIVTQLADSATTIRNNIDSELGWNSEDNLSVTNEINDESRNLDNHVNPAGEVSDENEERRIEETRFHVSLDHDYLGTDDFTERIKQEKDNETKRELESSLVRFQSNLKPLMISIPPPFETTLSKRVLVIQNDKTIPVEISVGKPESRVNLSLARGVSLLKKQNFTSSERDMVKVKPSTNLLLTANYDVPALKIAEARTFGYSDRTGMKPQTEDQTSKTRVTLGKDKYRLQSKIEQYEKVFKLIDEVKISETRGLVRFILTRLPLITRNASDQEYRRLHPYSCLDEEEFFGFTIAKQRAHEWIRAKLARGFLTKKPTCQDVWSVREILIYARLHGYTPFRSAFPAKSREDQGFKDRSDSKHHTCTEPVVFQDWLKTSPESNDAISETEYGSRFEDEIDVVEVDESKNSNTKENARDEITGNGNGEFTVLELEGKSVVFHEFICDTARKIGIKLFPEEILPNTLHCAAGRVIMKAVECLVDDLVRMSLAKAWERYNDTGYPKIVSVADVRRAILSREEFDIFTNKGLGSKHRSNALD